MPPGAKICFDGVADMVLIVMGVRVARWDGLTSVLRRFIGQMMKAALLYIPFVENILSQVSLTDDVSTSETTDMSHPMTAVARA